MNRPSAEFRCYLVGKIESVKIYGEELCFREMNLREIRKM